MQSSLFQLGAGQHLVWVPEAASLPLVLEMVRCHEPEPRVVLGGHAYLLAVDRRRQRIFAAAVDAAAIYPTVDLATESPLRLPVAPSIAHDVRIRIAKARASRLDAAMRATFRRAREREEHHGRLLAFDRDLGSRAIASWQNETFDTVTGWGDLQRFRDDPDYAGEVAFLTPHDEGIPQWLRLPVDETLLLDHGLNADERAAAQTVRDARAHLLGVVERGEDLGIEP